MDTYFSPFAHHHTVRAKLDKMVDANELTAEEAMKIYEDWKTRRQEEL